MGTERGTEVFTKVHSKIHQMNREQGPRQARPCNENQKCFFPSSLSF